ncbi:hypothetical protein MHTCC0001_29880 [Flavobacteriaceae bacterium MHTCC 0001]
MRELNIGLKKLIEDYRSGISNFEDTIASFEFLINQYSSQINNKTEMERIKEVKKAFYIILHKISNIKNIDLRMKNYQIINNELRLDLGLITK